VFYGQPVKTGVYSEHIDHYSVLRTVEDMYDLPHLGAANDAARVYPMIGVSALVISRFRRPASGHRM
jgi:hypothetical protein